MKRLLAALLLASCSAPVEADWYGDERFSPEERARIEAGVTWLAGQAGRPVPTISWGYRFEGSSTMPRTIVRDEDGEGPEGQCTRLEGTLYLRPDLAGTSLDRLAAHEFGHCWLGLPDGYGVGRDESRGLMGWGAPFLWTAWESRRCEESDACRGDRPVPPAPETFWTSEECCAAMAKGDRRGDACCSGWTQTSGPTSP